MIYAIVSIAVAAIGQAILKGTLNSLELKDVGFGMQFVTTVLWDWHILLGLGCYGFSALLWLYALSKCSLSGIYPFTALSFIFVILLSHYILGESINFNQSIGIGFIILGLFISSILK